MIEVLLLLPWAHGSSDEPGDHESTFAPQEFLAGIVFSYPPIKQSKVAKIERVKWSSLKVNLLKDTSTWQWYLSEGKKKLSHILTCPARKNNFLYPTWYISGRISKCCKIATEVLKGSWFALFSGSRNPYLKIKQSIYFEFEVFRSILK